MTIAFVLKEKKSSDQCTETGERGAGVEQSRIGSVRARARTRSARGSIGVALGVLGARDTCVDTLDDVFIVSLVEIVADRGLGAGSLDIRATADITNARKGDPSFMLGTRSKMTRDTYSQKVPAKSSAPEITRSLGKPAMVSRLVLLAIKKPPPMV